MYRAIAPLLLVASESFAHPGHGAPLVHMHEWDWAHWGLGIAMVVVAAIAIWRRP
jgi:hypothetical protein